MRISARYFLPFLLFLLCNISSSTAREEPVAKFTFNNKSERDEVSGRKARLACIAFTEDRFGNPGHAVYLCGNENSYVNLGTHKALKPRAGTVSLWLKMEGPVYSGKGAKVNPVIITKCADRDDFYESYAMYYVPETKRITAGSSRDSSMQCSVYAMGEFSLFTWHHLVIAYDDAYLRFYIDGKQAGKMPKNYSTQFNALDSVIVGHCANKKNNRFMLGTVDDILIFDRVLDDQEIVALYEAPNPNKGQLLLDWILRLCVCVAGIVLIYLIVKYRVSLTHKKEKQRLELANILLENELRINRALMNPHFIFNSLNTLHNYILKNSQNEASDYLIRFSKLIRRILESNLSDTISLDVEIELITGYLEIEARRFKEDIRHEVLLGPGVVPAALTIPTMMVQPFVENAVWHGLLDKAGDKRITISFTLHEQAYLKCSVEDNGTGLKPKQQGIVEKSSLATGFIRNRLKLLNKIHKLSSWLDITYKPDGQGTIATILLPILTKES